jgi:hypothetical protein
MDKGIIFWIAFYNIVGPKSIAILKNIEKRNPRNQARSFGSHQILNTPN